MDDSTLPPPRSTSPVPTAEPVLSSDSIDEGTELDISSNNNRGHISPKEEGSGDSEGRSDSGKQKRKRTSPEDQAFLEAQYKENPKPNKAARAEIVKSVKLNEKEVQIWFQNRRQINRRKSRPLLPHEIAAFGLGGMAALSSDPAPMLGFSSSQDTEEEGGDSQQEAIITNPDQSRPSQDIPKSSAPELATFETPSKTQPVELENSQTLPLKVEPEPAQKQVKERGSFSVTEAVSHSFTSTPGYLANRWNAVNSFSTPISAQAAVFATPSISQPIFPSSCPERINSDIVAPPPSRIRLSTGLDGRAELVEGEITPPRPHAERPTSSLSSVVPLKRMRSLQRSHSALPLGSLSRKPSLSTSYVPRLPSGRSRDTRTWEFCCDGEPRDELTTQAENESSGSAIAAISLIRSTSGTALKSNPSKRNTPSRSTIPGKRAKLGRASSSVARMQSGVKKPKPLHGHPVNDKNPLMASPSGDSDKENWLPNENGANPRRRPANIARKDSDRQISVLQDNPNIPTHTDLGVSRNKRRKATHAEPQVYEDSENRTKTSKAPDDDVERFMRGEVSPSKKGDLDCIQGLLSLSQGNWR